MRIFYSFLILLTTGILFFVPISEGIDAFRTDVKIDDLPCVTAVAETTDNLTLTHAIYEADPSSLILSSSHGADVPVLTAYADGNHTVLISGLADNTTRTMTMTYDIAAMTLWSGVDTLMNYTPLIWYLAIVGFIAVALVVVWTRRAE